MLLMILLMLIQQDCLKNREAIARALCSKKVQPVSRRCSANAMHEVGKNCILFYVPIMHSASVAISQGCCRAKSLNPRTHTQQRTFLPCDMRVSTSIVGSTMRSWLIDCA